MRVDKGVGFGWRRWGERGGEEEGLKRESWERIC